jgi:hypothetical protein
MAASTKRLQVTSKHGVKLQSYESMILFAAEVKYATVT